MNDLNLHEVTSIRVEQVETLNRSNGEPFVTRSIVFESKERGSFRITGYADDASELAITFE